MNVVIYEENGCLCLWLRVRKRLYERNKGMSQENG